MQPTHRGAGAPERTRPCYSPTSRPPASRLSRAASLPTDRRHPGASADEWLWDVFADDGSRRSSQRLESGRLRSSVYRTEPYIPKPWIPAPPSWPRRRTGPSGSPPPGRAAHASSWNWPRRSARWCSPAVPTISAARRARPEDRAARRPRPATGIPAGAPRRTTASPSGPCTQSGSGSSSPHTSRSRSRMRTRHSASLAATSRGGSAGVAGRSASTRASRRGREGALRTAVALPGAVDGGSATTLTIRTQGSGRLPAWRLEPRRSPCAVSTARRGPRACWRRRESRG